MFTIDELLSKSNQRKAMYALLQKKDGAGPDGLRISELENYWTANHERILQMIRDEVYEPGFARCYELLGKSGKKREIASINVLDRFIERMIQQKLRRYLEPMFLSNSFAYQEGKGPLDAVMKARDYIQNGNEHLCEVDISDYFGSIDHNLLEQLVSEHFTDKTVAALIRAYLHRSVQRDSKIAKPSRGILQGSSISPALSNLYLHSLDQRLESEGYSWMRFADNIYVYCNSSDDASKAYEFICTTLSGNLHLNVNKKKSGVYRAIDRRVLGYDFIQTDEGIEIRRHVYQPQKRFHTWHPSSVSKEHGAFHIVQDGIINRKDYSLLFENEDEKHHIPVEVTDQLNIYGSVTVAPAALQTMSQKNIRVSYFDNYGNLIGVFTPTQHGKTATTFLKQCEIYNDSATRLGIAKQMEIASIHNMRANLKYYKKKGYSLNEIIQTLTQCIVNANECKNVDGLLLVEARARRKYYEGFSEIVKEAGFGFEKRTRQPPRDECNAMISFGNTVLYNQILQIIWKTSLDPKIGVIHATNRRSFSLNLDFADLFKPVVVDRTIFSLVNRREIKKELHFETHDNGGVLFNSDGKRIFLQRFEQKLDTQIHRGEDHLTYRQLLSNEVSQFLAMVTKDEKYRPYKYY